MFIGARVALATPRPRHANFAALVSALTNIVTTADLENPLQMVDWSASATFTPLAAILVRSVQLKAVQNRGPTFGPLPAESLVLLYFVVKVFHALKEEAIYILRPWVCS